MFHEARTAQHAHYLHFSNLSIFGNPSSCTISLLNDLISEVHDLRRDETSSAQIA